jgi:hypothetical protein
LAFSSLRKRCQINPDLQLLFLLLLLKLHQTHASITAA